MPILGILASQISGHLTPPSSFESIATTTLGSNASTISLSSIPSTYKSLQLRYVLKNSDTGNASDILEFRINSDTGYNYAWHYMFGSGTVVTAYGNNSQNNIQTTQCIPGSYVDTNIWGVGIIDIVDYASTTKYKTYRTYQGWDSNGVAGQKLSLTSGLWMSTTAMSSITFDLQSGTSFKTGSTIALYGIKG